VIFSLEESPLNVDCLGDFKIPSMKADCPRIPEALRGN